MVCEIGLAGIIHDSTPDHVFATWKRVAIAIIRVETTLDGVKKLRQLCDAMGRQHPGGMLLLSIVEPDAPMPPPEVRSAMASFLAGLAGQVVASAVVYEGGGFRAAAVRGVVTGLSLVNKLPYPHKIFSTVNAAVNWFVATSPIARDWGGEAMITAVAEVRDRVARGIAV